MSFSFQQKAWHSPDSKACHRLAQLHPCIASVSLSHHFSKVSVMQLLQKQQFLWLLSWLCPLRGKTKLSTWDLLQSCSGPTVLMWKNIVFSFNTWMLYKVFPDFCSPVQQSVLLMCLPQPLGQLTHFPTFKAAQAAMLVKDSSTEESRRLTQAKLMISVEFFRHRAEQNSACTWKNYSHTYIWIAGCSFPGVW